MRLKRALILLLVILVIVSIGCAVPSIEERSGYFLTYEVDLSKVPLKDQEMAMNRLVEDVARSLLALGVNDPIIAIEGSNRFNAQIYGFKDIDKARTSIHQAAENLSVSLTQIYEKAITPTK